MSLPACAPRARAAPVLKWAGGKGGLLSQYAPHFPRRYRNYYEPFVGGGAVFFYLAPDARRKRVRLSDINAELISFYQVLQRDPQGLAALLAEHSRRHSREHYYAVRATQPQDPVERAARLLYLNKTCYNGLYRVNSRGCFNVPLGRYENPAILDEERLWAASQALQGVELASEPFWGVLEHARRGDLVYLDPPYQPLSATSSFTSYTAESFGEAEQRGLAEVYRELARRGCKVLLSNSDTPLVRRLYEGFRQHPIQARRFINSRADRRGAVTELLISNL
ncbi:MAG TPA: DNA adenine methylase [Candidatus Nitrosotenuis sp.]|jgi:DNA adenine methylase|nr:DNA adenine methylase [Candidatus Nitrosotenuis sp.]